MKRLPLEVALAAWIFLAANAVYGVEALVGGHLGSLNPLFDVRDENWSHNAAEKATKNRSQPVSDCLIYKIAAAKPQFIDFSGQGVATPSEQQGCVAFATTGLSECALDHDSLEPR